MFGLHRHKWKYINRLQNDTCNGGKCTYEYKVFRTCEKCGKIQKFTWDSGWITFSKKRRDVLIAHALEQEAVWGF